MKLQLLFAAAVASLSTSSSENAGPSTGMPLYSSSSGIVNSIWSHACLTQSTSNDAAGAAIEQAIDIVPPDAAEAVLTTLADSKRLIDPEICSLMEKYKNRFVCCSAPIFPNCDILLCGSIHVGNSSSDMVQDAIRVLKPQFIVLELCEGRIESLCVDESERLTLYQVFTEAYKQRSVGTFCMGLLTMMQNMAAKAHGGRAGGEQIVAAKTGIEIGSTVILGDRMYLVTIQRVFDIVHVKEKLKALFMIFFEVMTMSYLMIKDYIKKSEDQVGFVEGEIARFTKHMPTLAAVMIGERDEYLAQTLFEIARCMAQGYGSTDTGNKRIRVVAVVGAGHLIGIQKYLTAGGVSEERLLEISSSSKHPSPGTWPGRGMMQVLSPNIFDAPTPIIDTPEPVAPIVQETQNVQQQQNEQPFQPVLTAEDVSAVLPEIAVVPTLEAISPTVIKVSTSEEAITSIKDDWTEIGGNIDTVLTETASVVDVVIEEESEVDTESDPLTEELMLQLRSLMPVVEEAHLTYEEAKSVATASGIDISSDLAAHWTLFGVAVVDARKANELIKEAERRNDSPEEVQREIYGFMNAIAREETAAKNVIREAKLFVSEKKQ